MKVDVVGDEIFILMDIAAPRCDDGVEIIDGGEVFVDDRLVDKRPEMFGRLQFRRMERLLEAAGKSVSSILAFRGTSIINAISIEQCLGGM